MLLSVVVPTFNEEEVLEQFHERLKTVLQQVPCEHEVTYVNDGSRDSTLEILQRLRADDPCVGIINLSRNFGKEAAMTAGFDHAEGEAVVTIDADLQDPPELIVEFFRIWHKEKVDIVYGKRKSRAGDSWFKRTSAHAFYRLMSKVAKVEIPRDTGDFRLMSRRALRALNELREQHRFMKGLFTWIGFPSRAVPYEREARAAGKTKWSYLRLWNFSLEGITSFTILPLKVATYVGLVISLIASVLGIRIIVETLIYGVEVPGYPSLFVATVFFGGVQLFFLGIIGEYLGRVFNETKRRPLYIVQDRFPAKSRFDD